MDFIAKYKKTIVIVALIVIALVAIFAYRGGNMPVGEDAEVVIEVPTLGQTVSSPLTVRGKARGSWFFEANIRAELLDANGDSIVQGHGTADGDWMTADFVPFTAELTFTAPKTATGILRIRNDNPSGLPEKEKSFDVPVQFDGESSKTNFNIFFGNSKLNDGASAEFDCKKTYSVARAVPKTAGVAGAAIKELLVGPTDGERENGYYTNIPAGTELQRIALTDGVLSIDFSQKLDEGGGSCHMAALVAQISDTGKQFATVKEVKISINGRTEDILQP